jgi:hypothetical protein
VVPKTTKEKFLIIQILCHSLLGELVIGHIIKLFVAVIYKGS